MSLYILRRIGTGLVMLVALSMLVFGLLRLAPGDPVDAYIDPSAPMSSTELAAHARAPRSRPARARAVPRLDRSR